MDKLYGHPFTSEIKRLDYWSLWRYRRTSGKIPAASLAGTHYWSLNYLLQKRIIYYNDRIFNNKEAQPRVSLQLNTFHPVCDQDTDLTPQMNSFLTLKALRQLYCEQMTCFGKVLYIF